MATAITVPVADGNLISAGAGPLRLFGWSVRIDANAATVDLREGSSTGRIIATIVLAASTGDTQWFGESGVLVNSGIIYVDVTGTTTGLKGSIFTS